MWKRAARPRRTHQYDMYKRFIRWASPTGCTTTGLSHLSAIVRSLTTRQDDGFRKEVAKEFNELWVIDLKGNARTSGERRRREGGNIFEDKIRVGVAIYFLVRRKEAGRLPRCFTTRLMITCQIVRTSSITSVAAR